MKIFNGFDQLTIIPNPVLTIGTFDGVHLGHQKILQKLNDEAKKIGGESVLLTFYPHPRMVLFPDSHGLKLIQTQEEKISKLERMGLQNLIILPFTKEFSNLTAAEFVRDYLVNQINVKKLVIGYDHQFGKNREGTLEFLKNISSSYNFDVVEISAKEIDEVNISSTKIRKAIETGDIAIANKYLGEPFELRGKVVKGKELGRIIGYPTANIQLNSDVKIIPKRGVYAVEIVLPDHATCKGMMNIGFRPTVSNDNSLSIEVHLFDFNANLYDTFIIARLLSYIRSEQKFSSVEELKKQLQQDEKICRQYTSAISL